MPLFLLILIFFSPIILDPNLVLFPFFESTSITFEQLRECGISITCPFSPLFLGFCIFFFKFKPSTESLPLFGHTRTTLPVLPLSLPVITITLSPFFMFINESLIPLIFSGSSRSDLGSRFNGHCAT